MEVTFVRHRERRDRVCVTRSDGTSAAWDFPSYGDILPHDLCHLVVEDALGIAEGFWGLVAQGVEVALIDDQATLVRDGRPLVDQPDADFSDLIRAEEAVAIVGPVGLQLEQIGALTIAAPARRRPLRRRPVQRPVTGAPRRSVSPCPTAPRQRKSTRPARISPSLAPVGATSRTGAPSRSPTGTTRAGDDYQR